MYTLAMTAFQAEHTERFDSFTIALPLAKAFKLFEPEGERAWAPGWDPRYLYPANGEVKPGMVFTTGSGEEATIWTVIRHEPGAGLVEYQRVTPASRTGSVMVQCSEVGGERTRVTVIYKLTALTEHGNRALRDMTEAKYREFIASWAQSISRATGAAAQ
jgi:hypothetical protein